jgi:fatty acid desaturase
VLIASLSPEERRDLTRRSDRRGLIHLAGHLGLILIFGALIVTDAPLLGIWMVLQGIVLVFLFTLLHETVHDTPFASRWINRGVGHVCGFLLFIPVNWFRAFHFAHHKYTQIPGKDPELASPKPQSMRGYLVHVSGIPVLLANWKTLVRNALGHCDDPYVPLAGRRRITWEARAYLACYAGLLCVSLWLNTSVLVLVWLIPMVLGQPVLRLYLLAEHGRCAFVANMLENSRTTETFGLLRWLAWNMPYHAEHHSFPTVPFHKLPQLHRHTRRHLAELSDGYHSFHSGYLRDMQAKSMSE